MTTADKGCIDFPLIVDYGDPKPKIVSSPEYQLKQRNEQLKHKNEKRNKPKG